MTDVDRKTLEQRWVHSHEEDGPRSLVFRPGTWNFPRSRGRRSFTLGANGALLMGGPGPTDKMSQASGHWRLLPGGVIELSPEGGQTTRLKILSCGPDRLEVER